MCRRRRRYRRARGAQVRRQAVGAQFLARGTVQDLIETEAFQPVGDLAARIRGRDHDDPAQLRQRVVAKITTEENAAHGMRDKVDAYARCRLQLGEKRCEPVASELFHAEPARRIVEIHHVVARRPQRPFYTLHGQGAAAQPVEQHDGVGVGWKGRRAWTWRWWSAGRKAILGRVGACDKGWLPTFRPRGAPSSAPAATWRPAA